MDRAGAEFMESGEMQFGAVALVLVETIFGKLPAEVTHDPVARHFRDHARGRDGQTVAITFDDRRLGTREWKNGKTVDQDVIWRHREGRESNAHRLMRCAQNIDPVDFDVINDPDAPRDLQIGNQLVVDFFAQLGN